MSSKNQTRPMSGARYCQAIAATTIATGHHRFARPIIY